MITFVKVALCFYVLIIFSTESMASSGFKVKFKNIQKEDELYQIDFLLEDFKINNRIIDGKNWAIIDFKGNVHTMRKGFAKLPMISTSINLNHQDVVKVEIVSDSYQDYHLKNHLLPSKGAMKRSETPDKISYSIDKKSITNLWYPEKKYIVSAPYIIRDLKGINIYLFPFRYKASSKTLRIYSKVVFKIIRVKNKSVNSLSIKNRKLRGNRILPVMDSIYSSFFINYKGIRKENKRKEINDLGKILVLYPDRYKQAINPYIEYKRQKGYFVYEKKVSRGTNVKNIIKNFYNKDKDILYVQLVGGWKDIKSDIWSHPASGSGPMDPRLGCVAGDDYYPDLAVGRFVAKKPVDITTQVNKTIMYDTSKYASWQKKAIGIASSEDKRGDDRETDKGHINIIKNYRLLNTTYDNVYEGYGRRAKSKNISRWINSGVGLINYMGHGEVSRWVTSNFSTSHIRRLDNWNMLPIIVSGACLNGAFHKSKHSFAAAWLQKNNGGAIGAWMSTVKMSWTPPMRGQDYFNDLFTGGYDYRFGPGEGITTNSGASILGIIAMHAGNLMYRESPTNDDLEALSTWTVFGDSSLKVRNGSYYSEE